MKQLRLPQKPLFFKLYENFYAKLWRNSVIDTKFLAFLIFNATTHNEYGQGYLFILQIE